MAIPPLALAMVICDSVWQDPATGKCTILGTFSTVQGYGLPLSVSFCVYLSLTDARGTIPIRVQIVDADEEHERIAEVEAEANFPDPISVVEMVLDMGTVTFATAGEYRVQLFGDGDFVMERRLAVVSLEEEHP